VSFRLPHETPLAVLDFLTDLKEEHQRKFSSEIADRFIATMQEEIAGKPKKSLIKASISQYLKTSQLKKLNIYKITVQRPLLVN